MTIVLCPANHFQGNSHIAPDPIAANRDLATQLRELQTDVNAASAELADVTSPFDYRGDIAAAADFPLIAAVDKGDFYLVTTGCTDNGGATRTNTGQVFLTGDQIVWNGTTWTIVERGVSTAAPLAIGVAAAGTSPIKSNQDHVHAHGNQLGGTLHADVVAGVSSGFMTAAQATALAAIADDHVFARITALDIKTDEQNLSAALSGDVAKQFAPTHLILKVVTNVGALNADGTINVGTGADGAQIVGAVPLTGLTAVGATRTVCLSGTAVNIAANATLHVNVETAETGAGTLAIDAIIVGRQV